MVRRPGSGRLRQLRRQTLTKRLPKRIDDGCPLNPSDGATFHTGETCGYVDSPFDQESPALSGKTTNPL